MATFFQRVVQLLGVGSVGRTRTEGTPTSSNRASSFHLAWEVPPEALTKVEATFEVITPPTVPKLYFWALQVSFIAEGGRRVGGAHLGLQHHPDYPYSGAVNWGGYRDAGGELEGTTSALPSALNNINTRTYQWHANRAYRLRVEPSPDTAGAWRGSITDLATGAETVVRDLLVGAERLSAPMVWSEVFADCSDPSVVVRWSDFAAHTEGGQIQPLTVRLSYQSFDDGGCTNTNTAVDAPGSFTQTTNSVRQNRTGTRLTSSSS